MKFLAMRRISVLLAVGCLLPLAVSCTGPNPRSQMQSAAKPIPERDIAAAMAALSGATVLETDRYTPKVLVKGCVVDPLPSPTKSPDARLETAIAKAQAYHQSAKGIGLIILRDGAILHESYSDPATMMSQTESASMMKSVLGLVVGIAVEKGAIISIDDRVGDYISEWREDPRGDITVKELLTMSSGLGRSDFARILMSSDISGAALETPLDQEPGESFAYNNAVSQILGKVLDRQVRTVGYDGFQEFFQREFWCPLGNEDANLWIDRKGGSPRYYAGLQATLRDWARIGELIRKNGKVGKRQVVPADWISQMTTPSTTNPQYGFQIWLGSTWTPQRAYAPDNPIKIPHSAAYVADDVYFFDGFGGQRVYVIPSRGLTIARTGYTNLAYDDAVIVNLLLGAVP